jgi:MFS family permease
MQSAMITMTGAEKAIEGDATQPGAWRMLMVLSAAYAIAMIDRTILVPVIGYVQNDLAITDTEFGLLQGLAFALFYVLASIPLGYLIDRGNRVVVITVGLAVWSGATVLSAFASNFGVLFAGRTTVAVGEASLNPAAFSLLSDVFSKEHLGRAVALFSMGAAIGTGLAYVIGGALVGWMHGRVQIDFPLVGNLRVWQIALLAAGSPGLILAAIVFRLREPARSAASRTTAAVPTQSWFRFVKSRRAAILCVYGGSACQVLLLYSFMTWAPALLLRDHHLPGGQVGLIMGLISVAFGIAGFYAGGSLADRWWREGHRDAHMRVGFWAHCALLPLGVIAALTPRTEISILAIGLVNFLQVGTGPATISGLQLMTPGTLRGRTSAVMMTVVTLAGVTLGPLSVALLNDRVFHTHVEVGHSLAIVVLIVCPLAILLFGLGRTRVANAISRLESEIADRCSPSIA